MKLKALLWGLAIAASVGSASAANRPSGYVTICTEGKTCAVATSTNVAFGRADKFFYKVLVGSFVCNEATFGGRTAGGVNECSVPSGTSTSSVAASSVASSAASSKASSAASSVASSVTSSAASSTASSTGALGYYPGCQMPTATDTVPLTATQVVPAGTTFDGGNKRYNLSGGDQSEGQPPLFELQEGATIKNVIIGTLAADGVHCLGNCTVDHVWWEDIGEDAATALGPVGTVMNITCGAAYKGADKTFQHNGRGELRVSNFYVDTAGKLYRSCGDCTGNGGPRTVNVNNVITRDLPTIVGINSNFGDVATIRNLTLNNSGTLKTKICQVYKGVVKGSGSTSALGVEFNTPNCNVSQSDVTLLPPSIMNTSACAGSCPY